MNGNSDISGLLESLDPETLQRLMDMGVLDDQQSQELLKMQRGQADLGTATPQGMEVGGTYVAANPLQHMATAIRQWKGQKGIDEAFKGMGDITEKKRRGIGDIIRLWQGKKTDESQDYGYGY
jgi:hypothetical protein